MRDVGGWMRAGLVGVAFLAAMGCSAVANMSEAARLSEDCAEIIDEEFAGEQDELKSVGWMSCMEQNGAKCGVGDRGTRCSLSDGGVNASVGSPYE